MEEAMHMAKEVEKAACATNKVLKEAYDATKAAERKAIADLIFCLMVEEPVEPSASEAEFFERLDGVEDQFKEYAQEVHYPHLDLGVVALGYPTPVSEKDDPRLRQGVEDTAFMLAEDLELFLPKDD
ncbi:hypothetical protein ABZP36_006424 [Zizania latifolia]